MKSLCATCVRRGPNPTACTIPLAATRASRQPVLECPFFEDPQGRTSAHDLTGLLDPKRRPHA